MYSHSRPILCMCQSLQEYPREGGRGGREAGGRSIYGGGRALRGVVNMGQNNGEKVEKTERVFEIRGGVGAFTGVVRNFKICTRVLAIM